MLMAAESIICSKFQKAKRAHKVEKSPVYHVGFIKLSQRGEPDKVSEPPPEGARSSSQIVMLLTLFWVLT